MNHHLADRYKISISYVSYIPFHNDSFHYNFKKANSELSNALTDLFVNLV
jgi:hypothetical protein